MPPLGLEPWTFLIEQAHSTQNRVKKLKLPSLAITDILFLPLSAAAAEEEGSFDVAAFLFPLILSTGRPFSR